MSYYNNCRDHEKEMRQVGKEAKRKIELQREKARKKRGDPLQLLRLHGQSMKIIKDQFQYDAQNNETNLIRWRNDKDLLIDKYGVFLKSFFFIYRFRRKNKFRYYHRV